MNLSWKTCLKVGVSIFVLYICIHTWPTVLLLLQLLLSAAMPLLIGCGIAYLANIVMSMYERMYFPRSTRAAVVRTRRPVCLALAFLTLLGIISLIIGIVLPQLIDAVTLIIDKLPEGIDWVVAHLYEWNLLTEDLNELLANFDWESSIGKLIDGAAGALDIVVGTVTSVISGIATGMFAVIFSVYLLLSKERLGGQCERLLRRYMRPDWYEKFRHVLSVVNQSFRRFIVGQCIEAVILGSLCALGLWIMGIPYAAMIGALIAFTALIPIAGAFIGAGISALMILTVSPIKALIFLIFIIVLQQLEELLIYPRVVGSRIGLPAFWVLAAVTIGGGLFGILGMLFGVPLAAAIYHLLREDIHRPLSAKTVRRRARAAKPKTDETE